jgi:hypothetical protein
MTSGRAFGLHVTADFPLAGLGAAGGPAGRHTRLRERTESEVDAQWPGGEASVVFERTEGDRTLGSLYQHPALGWCMRVPGWGSYVLSPDGARVVCGRPPGLPGWQFEQFVMGQALPFAALLQGIELFHASAVRHRTGVLAISGRCRAGKSTTALHLVCRGARFFTDDVLAVEPEPTRVRCEPGPSVANVRDFGLRRLAEAGRAPFAGLLGSVAGQVRARVEAPWPKPAALRALYLLDHGPDAGEVAFEPSGDALPLLGSTFNVALRTPARARRQLEACTAIARSATVVRVRVPAQAGPGTLALAISEHADTLVRARPAGRRASAASSVFPS